MTSDTEKYGNHRLKFFNSKTRGQIVFKKKKKKTENVIGAGSQFRHLVRYLQGRKHGGMACMVACHAGRNDSGEELRLLLSESTGNRKREIATLGTA